MKGSPEQLVGEIGLLREPGGGGREKTWVCLEHRIQAWTGGQGQEPDPRLPLLPSGRKLLHPVYTLTFSAGDTAPLDPIAS